MALNAEDKLELEQMFKTQQDELNRRVAVFVESLGDRFAEANKVLAASEERLSAADTREAQRQQELDTERRVREGEARELHRRQVSAWERIADALEVIAKK